MFQKTVLLHISTHELLGCQLWEGPLPLTPTFSRMWILGQLGSGLCEATQLLEEVTIETLVSHE